VYAYFGAFSYRGTRPGLNILLALEPIVVLPGEYSNNVWQHFDYVFTFVDGLAERRGKFRKILFPAFDVPFTKTYLKTVDHSYARPIAEKKNAICMISGDKKSSVHGELYSKRIEAAQWFHDHSDIPFDVYGQPPFQLPNYRGPLTPHSQKFVTLAEHRYSVCFENIYDPFWSKGYVSEKLLDCLMCGTVPIYLGCYNIEEYIPLQCLIDFRQFKDYAALDQFLHDITDSQYGAYIEHIRNWVNEGNLSHYSMHRIYDKLLAFSDSTVAADQLSTLPWEPGLAATHAHRERQVKRGPIVWPWIDLASAKPSEAVLRGEFVLRAPARQDSVNSSHQDGALETVQMAAEKMHKTAVRQWFRDKGDSTLRLNYPLTEDSVVFEVGGYKGDWSVQIATRYNPYIYIFEPVPQFYSMIVERFKHNPKIKVFDYGLFDTTKTDTLVLDNDGSSLYGSGADRIEISLMDVHEFLKKYHVQKIDLININVEGAEYPLLKRMIDKQIVQKCRDIQVQFHTLYPNAVKLRDQIRSSLRNTHSLTYDYAFVWENWRRKISFHDSRAMHHKRMETTRKTILLSYPRSGNTWLRYCMEFLTKRLTIGYISPGVSIENGLGRLVDLGVDWSKPPIAYKRHGHTPNEKNSYDMNNDNLILLVRNYKECIVRHHMVGIDGPDRMFYSQTQGYRDGSLDYIGCIQIYEEWGARKLLIYYEDLISDPEPELVKVLDLLGANRTHLSELMNNLDSHRKQSVSLYTGNKKTSGQQSCTQGDPNKLLFHSKGLTDRQRTEWDQHLVRNYPDITGKYLMRYQEPDISAISGVIGVVFSKDRAMQLDATLRSFALHCKDSHSMDLRVLYTTSNQFHEQQYQQLRANYGFAEFIREAHFRHDLMTLLSSHRYILFLVDDNIFVRDFRLRDVIESLDVNRDAIGFSLRLGKNTTYCYMLDVEQRLPDFDELSHKILKYDWTEADYDFGYPLELSSSVYRVPDLLPLLTQIEFSNPNTLELMLFRNKPYYKGRISQILCYDQSVTFCNPVNVVQTLWENKSGVEFAYSTETLARMFSDGDRVDVGKYANMTPNSCHQEVEFVFIRIEPLVSIIILNFNRLNDVRSCLESIRRNTPEPHEIIVVDNASTDGSLDYLRTLSDITLVENPTNLGCPPARNQAIALAKGDFVVFLDNDTIVTPGWITNFIEHARRNSNIGLLGPRSNFVSGGQLVPQVSYRGLEELEEFAQSFSKQNKGCTTFTHRLVGFCMFIRREVIDKIGAHDPQFGRFGFEDEDYTWRAIIAGFKAAIAHDVFIHHTGGPQLRGNMEYNRLLQEAWEIFKRKWNLQPELRFTPELHPQDVLLQGFNPARHYVSPPAQSEVEALICAPPEPRDRALESNTLEEKPHPTSAPITASVSRRLPCIRPLWGAKEENPRDESLRTEPASTPDKTSEASAPVEVDAQTRPRAGTLPDKPRLTVCMIVKDEEKVLEQCLTSVQQVADEIVVLDTGSEDNTVSVAMGLGAKVFHFVWCDDFSAARNEALKHCSGDWILQIDADEEFLPESIPFLKKAISNPSVLAYALTVDNGPSYSDRFYKSGRLFRNHPMIRYSRPYHETIQDSTRAIMASEGGWEIVHEPKIIIRHYGYEDVFPQERRKLNQEIESLEGYVKDHSDDQTMAIRLAEVYNHAGQYAKAVALCNKILASDPHCAAAHHILGVTHSKSGSFENAIREFKKALSADPNLPWVHYHLGAHFNDQARYDEAISHLRKAVTLDPDFGKAYTGLGMAYHMKGRLDEAFEAYRDAIRIDRTDGEALFNLGVLYRNKGMHDEAIKAYKKALSADPKLAQAHNNLAVVYHIKGNHAQALEHCEKAMELGFQVHPQFLQNLKRHRK
jgi:FkbM family methyltransferase